jgi:hypothetical protein
MEIAGDVEFLFVAIAGRRFGDVALNDLPRSEFAGKEQRD